MTGLDLAPTGDMLAFSVREPLLTEDESRFVSPLYGTPFDGGAPYRLTYGSYSHDSPRWSPDGRHLVFLDEAVYRHHSSVLQTCGVQTPALIQHGDRDDRAPLSQGRELYNALKRQGVPVEMVIYLRQAHGPGEPRLMRDIIQRNLDGFARWLLA